MSRRRDGPELADRVARRDQARTAVVDNRLRGAVLIGVGVLAILARGCETPQGKLLRDRLHAWAVAPGRQR